MSNEKKVTGMDVLNWHGSEHSIEELADVLASIVNGDYDINLAREEILELSGDEIGYEDVVDVAKHLKMNPTNEEILYVLRGFNDEADRDPTGSWRIWIENLLYEQDLDQSK